MKVGHYKVIVEGYYNLVAIGSAVSRQREVSTFKLLHLWYTSVCMNSFISDNIRARATKLSDMKYYYCT